MRSRTPRLFRCLKRIPFCEFRLGLFDELQAGGGVPLYPLLSAIWESHFSS
jgi:hypothetical protein